MIVLGRGTDGTSVLKRDQQQEEEKAENEERVPACRRREFRRGLRRIAGNAFE
jgi:hypothetical protein